MVEFLQYQDKECLQFYFESQMQLDQTEDLESPEDNLNQSTQQRYSCILQELKQRNQYNRDIIKRYIKQLKKRYTKQRFPSQPNHIDEGDRKEQSKIEEDNSKQAKQINRRINLPKKRSFTVQREPSCRKKAVLNQKIGYQSSSSKIASLPHISFPNNLFAIQTVLQVLESRQNESNYSYKNKIIGNNIRNYLIKQTKIRQAQKLLCRGSPLLSNSVNCNPQDDKGKEEKQSGIKQLSSKFFQKLPTLKSSKYQSQIGHLATIPKEKGKNSKGRQQTEGSLLFKINKRSFPNINRSHLQRNRKCLQLFLKCSKNNQFEKNIFVNILKSQNYPQCHKAMRPSEEHSKNSIITVKKQS